MNKYLLWIPRVLGIAFAVFISIFALDVFGEGSGFWITLVALLIHLVPTYLIVAAIIISWKWPKVGGWIWIALGLLYLAMAGGKVHWSALVLLPAPAIIIGILFLLQSQRK